MSWTFGLKAIKSGNKAPDGGMGTELVQRGETLKGTAVIETKEETIQWIETEEKGKRLAISKNDSETTLTFEVFNPSLDTQAYYLGGSVVEGVGDKKRSYSPPKSKVSIEKSFVVETIEGYNIEIPNGKVVATPLGGTIGTENVLSLKVVVTAQEPTKEGVNHIYYREK